MRDLNRLAIVLLSIAGVGAWYVDCRTVMHLFGLAAYFLLGWRVRGFLAEREVNSAIDQTIASMSEGPRR